MKVSTVVSVALAISGSAQAQNTRGGHNRKLANINEDGLSKRQQRKKEIAAAAAAESAAEDEVIVTLDEVFDAAGVEEITLDEVIVSEGEQIALDEIIFSEGEQNALDKLNLTIVEESSHDEEELEMQVGTEDSRHGSNAESFVDSEVAQALEAEANVGKKHQRNNSGTYISRTKDLKQQRQKKNFAAKSLKK